MKIIRQKSGYRMNLTEGEFSALRALVDLGCQWVQGDPDILDAIAACSGGPAHVRAMNRFIDPEDREHADADEILKVTEDRR